MKELNSNQYLELNYSNFTKIVFPRMKLIDKNNDIGMISCDIIHTYKKRKSNVEKCFFVGITNKNLTIELHKQKVNLYPQMFKYYFNINKMKLLLINKNDKTESIEFKFDTNYYTTFLEIIYTINTITNL
jgi:hypothetical protein